MVQNEEIGTPTAMQSPLQSPVDIKNFIFDLGCSPEEFLNYAGISTKELIEINSTLDPLTLSRFNDIRGILTSVRHWFDSKQECWSWYISQPIIGLGNMTASEVINRHDVEGIKAVLGYITSKEAGGFE